MSAWLNMRLRDDPKRSRELFPTEERAIEALTNALARHKARGHEVHESKDILSSRVEVTDQYGFVAEYWVSDKADSSAP